MNENRGGFFVVVVLLVLVLAILGGWMGLRGWLLRRQAQEADAIMVETMRKVGKDMASAIDDEIEPIAARATGEGVCEIVVRVRLKPGRPCDELIERPCSLILRDGATQRQATLLTPLPKPVPREFNLTYRVEATEADIAGSSLLVDLKGKSDNGSSMFAITRTIPLSK